MEPKLEFGKLTYQELKTLNEDNLFVMRHALAEIKGEGVLVKAKIIEWLEKAIAQAEGKS